MSAILYIGGVLYLLAVNYQVGKHYDRDFDLWTRRIRHATMSGIYMSVPHCGKCRACWSKDIAHVSYHKH